MNQTIFLTLNAYGIWPVSAQMNQLINSFATSAYRIMTGVKRLDKVRDTTVLTSVSRNELIHTVHDNLPGAAAPVPEDHQKHVRP